MHHTQFNRIICFALVQVTVLHVPRCLRFLSKSPRDSSIAITLEKFAISMYVYLEIRFDVEETQLPF